MSSWNHHRTPLPLFLTPFGHQGYLFVLPSFLFLARRVDVIQPLTRSLRNDTRGSRCETRQKFRASISLCHDVVDFFAATIITILS